MKYLKVLPLTFFVVVSLLSCTRANDGTAGVITIDEVRQKLADSADFVLLDVRTEGEFNGELGHLPGAILIPVHELENRISELDKFKDKEIIVYCRSGNRSGFGEKILSDHGFTAFNMIGGMIAWNKEYGKPNDTENQK